jgi:predicted ATPase
VDRVRKGDLAGAEDDLSKLLPEIRDPEMLEEARRLLEKIRAVEESPGE